MLHVRRSALDCRDESGNLGVVLDPVGRLDATRDVNSPGLDRTNSIGDIVDSQTAREQYRNFRPVASDKIPVKDFTGAARQPGGMRVERSNKSISGVARCLGLFARSRSLGLLALWGCLR